MAFRRLRVHALIDDLGCGGAELLLAEFAQNAPAAGIDISVGYLSVKCGDVAAARLRRIGIEPHLVPVSRMLSVRDFQRVRSHIAAVAPDVVHTHLDTSDFLAASAARSLGRPVVTTLHSVEWAADSLADSLRLRLSAGARRRCATRVIAVSDSARRAYLATGWDRPDRVVVVHNAIDGTPQPGAGPLLRRELDIPADAPLVAMVSTLRPEKAHDVALSALLVLRERLPAARLLIVGEGPARDGLEPLIRAAGDSVVLPGYRDDVMAVMDAADVVLHPSHADAFPTTLLEAMAASVPVVATAVGGIPEIINDGEQGLLIAPPPDAARVAAALETLLTQPELRIRMGSSARERFERRFGLARWIGETRSVYEEVLAA